MPTTTTDAAGTKIVVGVADMALSDDPSALLITYALGSCIGVTIYDPNTKIGGMLHFMLPSAKASGAAATEYPFKFADTGIPMMFKQAYAMGARKEDLIVCAAGGAEVLDQDGHFKVGSRNRTMMRKLFWKNDIFLTADDTGGSNSRTLSMRLEDGTIDIRSKGTTKQMWP